MPAQRNKWKKENKFLTTTATVSGNSTAPVNKVNQSTTRDTSTTTPSPARKAKEEKKFDSDAKSVENADEEADIGIGNQV